MFVLETLLSKLLDFRFLALAFLTESQMRGPLPVQ